MTVYFHGSFGLNRKYMSGVLATSLKKPNATGDEIAEPFGYKAPFTGRYKSWLHKTGLATKGRKTVLTPVGEVVWENDPKLESLVTQWLLHYELSTDPEPGRSMALFCSSVPTQARFFQRRRARRWTGHEANAASPEPFWAWSTNDQGDRQEDSPMLYRA